MARPVVVLARGDDPASTGTAQALGSALEGEGAEAVVRTGVYASAPLPPDALAAVALDSDSLEHACQQGAGHCVAVPLAFDARWDDFGSADQVLLAHDRLVAVAVSRGARRSRVVVVGPIAPSGFEPASDRAAVRAELGIEGSWPLVLVPGTLVAAEGPVPLLLQLGLIDEEAHYVFDVGRDAVVADALRDQAPAHDLRAHMVATGEAAGRAWQAADLVLGHPLGSEIALALAVGAPMVLLPGGRQGAAAGDALEASGVALEADALATLAVTLDQALGADALAGARQAVVDLHVEGSAERAARVMMREAMARDSRGPKRGLPKGLEALGELGDAPDAAPAPDSDLEARIDAELLELKSRL